MATDQAFYNIFADLKFISRWSKKARIEMYEIFMREMRPAEESTILDVGVSITGNERIQENILEKLYPHPHRITMLGIHDGAFLEEVYKGSRYIRYDANCPFPFPDRFFDISYCNSVLEHVGQRDQQKRFVAELLRVSRKIFLITPNRAYPVDFHKMYPFLHWLPMNIYRRILGLLGDPFYSKPENLNLLYKKDLASLLKEQGAPFRIISYKWFGLPAHLIAIVSAEMNHEDTKA
jgi:hypothetical protein